MELGFFLTAAFLLSIYDFRHRLIPNWATLPLLLVGLVLHFPAVLEVWTGSVIILLFGYLGGGRLGFGDVKLWLAYFWILPLDLAGVGTQIGFQVILLTAFIQVAVRWPGKTTAVRAYPAAWRVFLSALLVFVDSLGGVFHA